MTKRLAMTLAGLFLMAACTGDGSTTPPVPVLTTLNVSLSAPSAPVGQIVTATATGVDQDGEPIATGVVTWSSNSAAATVASDGKITTVSPGQATITASAGGKTGQATLTITALPAAALMLRTPPSPTVANRSTFAQQPAVQLVNANGQNVAQAGVVVTATVTPFSLAGTFTATTDAAGVATFAGFGVAGTAGPRTITFSAGSLTPAAANVSLVAGAPAFVLVNAGNQQTATTGTAVAIAPSVVVTDADANRVSGASIAFDPVAGSGTVTGSPVTTDANGNATVGKWTLGAAGTNTLFAHVVGNTVGVNFTATATAPVVPVLTTLNVTISPSSVVAGQFAQASATGTDQFGAPIATGTVAWTSSTAVATIAPDGKITAVSPGQSFITGTAGGKSGQAIVTVTASPATRLLLATAPLPSAVNRTDLAVQPVVQVANANGAVAQAGVVVTATVSTGSVTGTTTATTDANGTARFTALRLQGTIGARTLTFSAPSLTPVSVDVALAAGPADLISINAGNAQSGLTGAAVAVAPSVLVTDFDGNPVPGAQVTFAVTAGGGVVIGSPATSNANGVAALASWTLGAVGTNTLNAALVGRLASVNFTATATQNPTPPTPVLTTLVVTINPATIPVGQTANATVVGKDQFGANIATGAVVWSSTAPATISQSGVITGVSAGVATITATAAAVSGQGSVTVTQPAHGVLTRLILTANPASIVVGSQTQLTLTGKDAYDDNVAPGAAAYSSTSNATVNSSGVVTGLAVGTATITATAQGVSVQLDIPITASGTPVLTTLEVTATPATLHIGESGQLTVVGKDQNGNPIATGPVGWYTSASGIVAVGSDGVIIGVAAGQAILSAGAGNKAGQTIVTVIAGTPGARLTANAPPAGGIPNRTVFSTQPVVQLVNTSTGQAIALAGVPVTATLTSGGGTLVGTLTVNTDASGAAHFSGLQIIGVQLARTITFSATGYTSDAWHFNLLPGIATNIVKKEGDNQTVPSGRLVPIRPQVFVTDPEGNPVPGVHVVFDVLAGNGTITGASLLTAPGSGLPVGSATVGSWRLGDVGTNTLRATAPDLASASVTFSATATAPLAACSAMQLLVEQTSFRRLDQTLCTRTREECVVSPFTGPQADGNYFYDKYVIDIPAGATYRLDVTQQFETSFPSACVYTAAGNYVTFVDVRNPSGSVQVKNTTGATQQYQVILISNAPYVGGLYSLVMHAVP